MTVKDTLFPADRPRATYLVALSYLLLLGARLLDTLFITPQNQYFFVLPLQLLIFALPTWLYLRKQSDATPASLRLTLPARSAIPLIILALPTVIVGTVLLSVIFGSAETASGGFRLYDTFSSELGGFWNGVYLVIVYAALPALCEEIIFRGLLIAEYQRYGALSACILSSLLFGMLHFDLQLLPVYFFAGLALALLTYTTRSLLSAIAVHFAFNLFGIFIHPYLTVFYQTTGSRTLFVIMTVALLLLSAALFCLATSRHLAKLAQENCSADYPTGLSREELLRSFLPVGASIPFALCVILFIVSVILF